MNEAGSKLMSLETHLNPPAHPPCTPSPLAPVSAESGSVPALAPSTPDWRPFELADARAHGDAPRSIRGRDGIGDRLRAAAFAEVQARDAFRWAAARFAEVDPKLRKAWLTLADSEQRHLDWLLERMRELEIPIGGRKVSDHLWHSLMQCQDARTFAHHMAGAEERGRQAGERFYQTLLEIDPITAQIFHKIAEEEVGHIALAQKFFPLPE